ncbi:reactive mitochondrial oxygen species modulator 1-domain-containing protein [Epithele typhae]|uniref:reactive mitochondrial oxygen species modulator 1-domain-containing protein n=1 Tax=Epithele typhae TaxID=378194 RepID=UPI0020075264|nr:reactive mitochondrial oxygen species modulator 1-domain-containing protein [Epithele typhae]KAH9927509.1 reactive mitochondrial oxygen species modulator 1-domain-containing protein [Epithele typhae]
MPPAPIPQGHGAPTVWQKRTMGAAMGAGVGLTMGFLFGGFSILRGGAGPRGVLPTLSQYMLSSAATFSFFLAIGSVIRNDGELPAHLEAARLQLAHPVIRSRAEGLAHMRMRWSLEQAQK